jgi:CDP-2,3-bis-(O-geranylgeranyl)-sn-glycerol synthase
MMDISQTIVFKSLYFMLPAYFANMAPVFVKHWFKFMANPIDQGIKVKKHRLFGSHKTWRGVIFGIIFAIGVAYIQSLFDLDINLVDYSNWFVLGFLMGFGAMVGDVAESFIKRRMDIRSGARFVPWDQLDYLLGSLLLTFYLIPNGSRLFVILSVLIVSPLLHILANHIAYWTGIRDEKW